ncbi:hypothetical protein ABPG72_002648 [Tetrahymena utriculariae]
MIYGCYDLDALKTSIPVNCADQAEIDKLINGNNSHLSLKFYTFQYNTVSQKTEVNYRNTYIYTKANQQIFTQIKTKNQDFDRQYTLLNVQAGSYSTVILLMDEIIQQIQIQYPSFPQILAMVSGVFTLLMFVEQLEENHHKEEVQVNQEQLNQQLKLDANEIEIKDQKLKDSFQFLRSRPIFYNRRKASQERFENNKTQNLQNTQATPIILKLMNNSQSTQYVNFENFHEIISENSDLDPENLFQSNFCIRNDMLLYNFKDERDIENEKKNSNLINNLNAIQDLECSQKILQDIAKIRKEMQKQKGQQLQKVQYQITKDMNIFNFIKDIILIKTAIMMILTKDQLAALNLVGCSQSFLEMNLNNISCILDEYERIQVTMKCNQTYYKKNNSKTISYKIFYQNVLIYKTQMKQI